VAAGPATDRASSVARAARYPGAARHGDGRTLRRSV